MTKGLDKARELMPLLEAAKAQGDAAYRAALAEHDVTVDHVAATDERRAQRQEEVNMNNTEAAKALGFENG